MKHFIFASILFSGLVLPPALAQPTTKVAGFSIVLDPATERFGGFSTLNQIKPINLVLIADLNGQSIVSMNDNKSKIESFSDDTGKDLKGDVWAFSTISDDLKQLRFEITGENTPAPHAQSLKAKGSLYVHTAEASQLIRSELTELTKNQTVTISDSLSFKIIEAGKPKWGDEPFSIELQIKRDIPEVAEILFYDKDGKLLETVDGGNSRSSFNKSVTLTKSYRFQSKAKEALIEARVWKDMKEVEVPFDISVSMGDQ